MSILWSEYLYFYFFCHAHFFGWPQIFYIPLQTGCHKPNETSPLEPVYPVSTNGELFPWAQFQLPRSIHPLNYDLTLNPDLDNMTFTGCTVISMLVLHDTKRIVLHSANLNISKASFKVRLGGWCFVKEFRLLGFLQFVKIKFMPTQQWFI